MKKNKIIIKLNSSLTRSDREKPEIIELNTTGLMERFGDGYKISYSNNFTYGKSLETVITVNKDNAVIERTDDHFSKIFLDKGKSSYSQHKLPFGMLKVKTSADEIKNDLAADGGELFLKYCVNLAGEYSAENEVEIRVKKVISD